MLSTAEHTVPASGPSNVNGRDIHVIAIPRLSGPNAPGLFNLGRPSFYRICRGCRMVLTLNATSLRENPGATDVVPISLKG